MTITLATLTNRIGERLQDTSFQSISLASVIDVINQSLRYYKFRRFWFNDRAVPGGITLVQGQNLVPNIPSDFLVELPEGGLTIFYGNVYYPLEKRSSEIFDSENVSGIGLPYMYTFRAQNQANYSAGNQGFEVYYKPNIAYTLLFRYLGDYPDLVNSTDTNDFLAYADMMIYYNALSRIFGEYKQDSKMEAYYTSRANDEEENVSRRTTGLAGTGQLIINSQLTS